MKQSGQPLHGRKETPHRGPTTVSKVYIKKCVSNVSTAVKPSDTTSSLCAHQLHHHPIRNDRPRVLYYQRTAAISNE